MTEQEWLSCSNPSEMLSFLLRGKVSERKLLLFAVACCRRAWPRIQDPRSRNAIDVAERFAAGEASREELQDAQRNAEQAREEADRNRRFDSGEWAVVVTTMAPEWKPNRWPTVHAAVSQAARALGEGAEVTSRNRKERRHNLVSRVREEKRAQCDLLRCAFGNPFREFRIDPQWLTFDVTTLARGIYDEMGFDRMSFLSDALQEAGCEENSILSHCRDDHLHSRGCWILDAILGNS